MRRNTKSALPQIVVTHRPLRDITADALASMVAANQPPTIFVRRGCLVRVRCDEKGRAVIDDAREAVVRHSLARSADCVEVRPNASRGRHIAPPSEVVGDLLALGTWPGLPPLEAITEVPALRPEGTLLDQPGYDSATRLVYQPRPGLRLPSIPTRPSTAEAHAAREILTGLLNDFPFVGPADRANTLAHMLTPIVRPMIASEVPLALISKPKRGTGASLLAQIALAIATGSFTDLTTMPSNEDEMRKKITTLLRDGTTFIFFDNVETTISSALLAAVLTAPEWTDRLLGRNESVRVPNRATWVATGNNLRVGGDIARRSYMIRLDAKLARPWKRKNFHIPNLRHHVLEHRGELLAALITLARHWVVIGRPVAPDLPTLGSSFDDWGRTVGGILAAVGIPGFLTNLNEFHDQTDDDESTWEAFLRAWTVAFNEEAKTTRDIEESIRVPGSPLRDVLPSDLIDALVLADRGQAHFGRSLGKALAKRRDAVFGDYRLEETGTDMHAGSKRWRVVRVPHP